MQADPTNGLFPSRNRDAFGFKSEEPDFAYIDDFMFQSRNRDAFGFKYITQFAYSKTQQTGFNLVIEMLLVSSGNITHDWLLMNLAFQSRNRDAFGFKNEIHGRREFW